MVGVSRFCRKMGGSGFFLEKWVRVGHYYRNKGRSVSFLSKNWFEWVVFLETWFRSLFLKNGWEWVVFIKKMGGSGLLFLKNGWEWVTFLENWWEWLVFIEKWV